MWKQDWKSRIGAEELYEILIESHEFLSILVDMSTSTYM